MKKIKFSALFSVPVFTICALLIASANQGLNAHENNPSKQSGAIFAKSAADGGRLLIRRSPLLGYNVSISLMIDGRSAGELMRHPYDRYITPGRHSLTASPTSGGAWEGTLDVRPGETYSYSASYNLNKLVLTAVTGSR